MCRCTCAMLILLAVCFTEPGNTQQTLATNTNLEIGHVSSLAGVPSVLPPVNPTTTIQPPPQSSSVPNQPAFVILHRQERKPQEEKLFKEEDKKKNSIQLKTACVITLEKQCVFKMNGINSGAFYNSGLPISNTSDIPCKPECSSDSPLCSCCDESVQYLQEILQAYSETYTNYESKLAAYQIRNISATEYKDAETALQDIRNKLLNAHECSQVNCSSREMCEFIKCKPKLCDTTTTTITSAMTIPTTSTTSTTRTTRRSSTTTTTTITTTTSTADDNGQSQTISTTLASTSSNMTSTDVFSAKQGSSNVAAVIIGVVVSLLVAVGVAVFLIFWWRRRRAQKGGKTHGSPSTIAFVTEAETGESQYSELSNSVGCRQTADRKTSGAQPNRDSKYDHEYSVIPADVVKFTHPNDLNPGYDVLIDVTKRKLPPAPAQDGEYSLARNPDGEMKKKPPVPSGLKPAVHSLAKTTAIQDLKGKNNAEGERKEKQGQYFVLEKDEDDFDNAEKKDGQYLILEKNADGDKQSETGRQYFVVEKENADEKPEIGGQYFVLEKESADENPETGGQYFVLEKDTASGNDKRENGGQYFVLEKEDADENPETGGQYFVLEKDSSDASGQDQTGDNKVYSSLNRDDMEPVDAAEQASEYTALDNSRAGTTSPGSQSSVVPQHESVYSLQKPID